MPTAKWIWAGNEPNPTNRFTWFRKVVHLDRPPESTEVRFAADSTARLWINGTLVRRKVTRFHEPAVRAESVQVAPHLKLGANVVVVLHHNWGDIVTFQRTANVHAGLYLEGTGLHTDETWRWIIAEEFEQHERQFRGLAGDAPRIRFPIIWNAAATDDPSLYHVENYDDRHWHSAVIVETGPWPERPALVETRGQRESLQPPLAIVAAGRVDQVIIPDDAATHSAAALARGGSYTIAGRSGEKHYLTFDWQRPVHGYPYIEVEGGGRAEITLGYGEVSLSPYSGQRLVTTDGYVDVDSVVARHYVDVIRPVELRRLYEIPDERTARWVTIHVSFASTGSLTIHRLGIVKSQYPIELRGSFQSGHERLDQIVKLAIIHAEVTMSDTYVDTPGREDGQWIEDARPRAILASRWFGDIRLRRLMIRTLAEGQSTDGNLHPFFPSNFPYGGAEWDWSLQWIGMVADDYQWTGDVAFLSEYMPVVARFWAALELRIGSDGIWREDHVFGDIRNSAYLTPGHTSGIVTPWVVDRLKDSARLARVINLPVAEHWDALASKVAGAFRATHLTDNNVFGVLLVADSITASGVPTGFGQAGQAIPLYDGLLTSEEAAVVIETAFPAPDASPPSPLTRWNNPTFSYRILRGLSQHGYHDRALAHLLERYGPYLPGHPDNEVDPILQGPYGGPLPEYWISRRDSGLAYGDVNDRHPIDPTGSHGWGAVPLLWLHEYLLGVTILEPGGAELAIRPVSAGLPFVTGTTMTPHGAVYVHLEPSEPTLVLEIPRNVRARVRLPDEFIGTKVLVDGRLHIGGTEVQIGEGRFEFVCAGSEW